MLNEPEIQISYLVIQHKREVLDRVYSLDKVIKETFSEEFMSMFVDSIFTPLMHEETPDLSLFPIKKESTVIEKGDLTPKVNDVKSVAYLR